MRLALMILALVALGLPAAAQGPIAGVGKAGDPILNDLHDLTVGPDGWLYIAVKFRNRVVVIDPASGALLGVPRDGNPGIGPGNSDDPEGVAAHGGVYFFAGGDNNRIVRYVVLVN